MNPDTFGLIFGLGATALLLVIGYVAGSIAMRNHYQSIRSRVYFSKEMPASAVVELLLGAGFVDPVVDRDLFDIRLAQALKMPLLRGIERMVQDRYAICVTKPKA